MMHIGPSGCMSGRIDSILHYRNIKNGVFSAFFRYSYTIFASNDDVNGADFVCTFGPASAPLSVKPTD